MRFLFSLDFVKYADMITDLKNDTLKNPDTTYPVDLVSRCDLATNWCSKSTSSRNQVPASGVGFNTTSKGNDRNAGDKGQKKNVNVNVKDAKAERKVDCWNCGENHFARDRKKPNKKEGGKKGKVNVTFRDYADEDYSDGVIRTCFDHRELEELA